MAVDEKKASFLTTLKYEEIPGTLDIRLLEDFAFYSAVLGQVVVVPTGFMCDGESVFFKSSTEAGVGHDYLYRKDSIPLVSRVQADAVFYELSRLDKSSWIISQLKWLAVRSVSWLYFHKKTVRENP